MRSIWLILVAASVLAVTACLKNPKDETVSTVFPKGYARPITLEKGNWKNGYNFALGEALQQADRTDEEPVKVAPEVVATVIPYAPGKAPITQMTTQTKVAKVAPSLSKVVAKGEKKLKRLMAKLTKKTKARPTKDVMLSAAGR